MGEGMSIATKPQRVVTLPNGRQVTLATYTRAWRALRATGPGVEVRDWTWYPITAGEVLRSMQAGMNDRINRHMPHYGQGRKWDDDWQRHVLQFARRINTPRLIVLAREVPKGVPAERLVHRLTQNWEE